VQYVRSNFFAGEGFRDITDCRERAVVWCSTVAGSRVHGTTQLRPAEVFAAEEQPLLLPVPETGFVVPSYTHPKVAPDRHVEVAKALHSVPGELIGQRILARADGTTVKLYWRGQLIKVHPHQPPGRRHTDPADVPSELSTYAMRDLGCPAPVPLENTMSVVTCVMRSGWSCRLRSLCGVLPGPLPDRSSVSRRGAADLP
jgi:hypothetical protein